MDSTETEPFRDADDEQSPALLPKARLVYTPEDPAAEGRVHTLAIGATAIGREPPGDGIRILGDKRISRVHATLHVAADLSLTLCDGDSKNGTFRNGRRLADSRPEPLADGDVIRVGDSFLVVRHEPLSPLDGAVPALLGRSLPIVTLRHELRRVAPGLGPVLLLGETGTGKELAAQALHRYSGRPGDFVAVNCAAIPESLAESQLFGHVAGAFTGARPHTGFLRAAHGGTLFLDEVGELPLPLQAKLLRALQERAVVPVGAVKPIACEVRLVAATHRNLSGAVEAGTFREDLYARIAGIVLHLPPLRERREDILPLLRHALGDGAPRLPTGAIEALLLYSWPRNVRELLQIAEHIRLLGCDKALLQRLGPAETASPAPSVPVPAQAPAAQEAPPGGLPGRAKLVALMTRHSGVIRQVAEALGCSRRQVGRMLEHYQLDADAFRKGPAAD